MSSQILAQNGKTEMTTALLSITRFSCGKYKRRHNKTTVKNKSGLCMKRLGLESQDKR